MGEVVMELIKEIAVTLLMAAIICAMFWFGWEL